MTAEFRETDLCHGGNGPEQTGGGSRRPGVGNVSEPYDERQG
jgi:hypothetical protein